ncbi:MAG: selenide, water dikinase SelD, partial [Terriglobales bacterium]
LANQGAQVGDRLLFTKSLGTGVISTAIKKGTAKQAWIDAAVKSMTTLNKAAAEVIANANDQREKTDDVSPIHALTDVTGFGLIGHARELALASNVGLILNSKAIPILEGALECIRAGYIPGGLNANRDFAECLVGYADSVPEEIRTLLFDPQTAGGLLISVAAAHAKALTKALQAAKVPAVEIGEVVAPAKPQISVV